MNSTDFYDAKAAVEEQKDISDEDLIADYRRLADALEGAKDYQHQLAYGLALYGVRRIMDDRKIPYPEM